MNSRPLILVCIEPRFPGRLGATADWLVRRRGYCCHFYCAMTEPPTAWPESAGKGLQVVPFQVGGVAREAKVAWMRGLERGLCYAYGCWEVLDVRRPRRIDLVLSRSAGLGSSLFVPATLPGVPRVQLFDYYYHPHAHDLTDEAGPDMPVEYFHWRHAANAMDLLDLENGVVPWTTTCWQRDLYPREYRDDFLVLHDGIDTERFQRRPRPVRRLLDRTIPPETRVVSFVAQRLDRVRGFDRFMAWANALLRAGTNALFIVIGAGTVQRGLDVEFFQKDYQAYVLQQTPHVEPERFWFLGEVPQATVSEVFALSDLHVYPSRVYPVARSLLEAMSAGCVVLAWDSAPVREVITPEQTGIVVPPAGLDEAVRRGRGLLEDPAAHRAIGEAAASVVRERYARDTTLAVLAERFARLVGGHETAKA